MLEKRGQVLQDSNKGPRVEMEKESSSLSAVPPEARSVIQSFLEEMLEAGAIEEERFPPFQERLFSAPKKD